MVRRWARRDADPDGREGPEGDVQAGHVVRIGPGLYDRRGVARHGAARRGCRLATGSRIAQDGCDRAGLVAGGGTAGTEAVSSRGVNSERTGRVGRKGRARTGKSPSWARHGSYRRTGWAWNVARPEWSRRVGALRGTGESRGWAWLGRARRAVARHVARSARVRTGWSGGDGAVCRAAGPGKGPGRRVSQAE